MGRSTSEATIRRKLEVTKYTGGNEFMDRIVAEGDKVYIVQGSWGRVPVLANSVAAAKDRYVEKFAKQLKEEIENAVTDEEE